MLINGDCLQVLQSYPSEKFDLIVTDPPYGISFMGKDWDKALPDKQVWKECFRVLKHGKFAFIMCSPRQDVLSRMIISLEDAGFRTNYTSIYWTYASGFPKAANISKLIDKRNGTTDKQIKQFAEYIKSRRLELGLGLTEVDNFVCGGSTMYSFYEGRPIGIHLPREQEYQKIKQILKLDNRFDNLIGEAEREIISREPMTIGIGGNSKRMGKEKITSLPATDLAKKMEGAYVGFQPKPAVEVILVVSKGKSLTWLDDCRIPYSSDKEIGDPYRFKHTVIYGSTHYNNSVVGHQKGRFPANLLVSDDVLNDGVKRPSSGRPNALGDHDKSNSMFGGLGRKYNKNNNCYPDEGSYSRYFSLDSWSKTLNVGKSEKNQWEDQTVEQGHISQKENTNVTNAENNLSTTKATEKKNITSAQENVQQYSDSENLNPNVLSAEMKQDCTETNTVHPIAEINQDMGILQQVLKGLENELTTLIMQREQTPNHQKDVNYTINKMLSWKGIIQTSINQLKLSGYVNPVIIELMRQDLNQDQRLMNLPPEVRRTFPFIVTAKASKSERNKGLENLPSEKVNDGRNTPIDNPFQRGETLRTNKHPTVKPLKLMSYLITMGSREDDIVLDPFCGSGTTCIAAQTLHRNYVGIEINEDYYKIAEARLSPYLEQTKII